MGDDLMTLRQAAEALGLKVATVTGWADRGLLPIRGVRGNGRTACRLVTLGDVQMCQTERLKHPARRAGGLKRAAFHEPTEEELNIIIKEQMDCLPDWWDSDR